MDIPSLTEWRARLIRELAELSESITKLEAERSEKAEQLEHVGALLRSLEGVSLPEDRAGEPARPGTQPDFEKVWRERVVSPLNTWGWAVQRNSGRESLFSVNRNGVSALLWRKESRYYPETADFWFGIRFDRVSERAPRPGAVVHVLPGTGVLAVPFDTMREWLSQANETSSGVREYHIRFREGHLWFYPGGAGPDRLIDIPDHLRDEAGLRRIVPNANS